MTVSWYDSRRLAREPERVRRRHPRKPVNQPAVAALGDGERPALRACVVVDISAGGAKLKIAAPEELPETFTLILSWGARTTRRCLVRWRSQTEVGVQFIGG